MSLWTPGGERPVGRADAPTPTGAPGAAGTMPGGMAMSAEQEAEAQQIAAEMAAVREQLAGVPAAQVVTNHAMGCWELAAIHLSAQPPKFDEAQIAVDAFGALVDVLQGRLGDDEATLNDALAQLRLAFVQLKASFADAAPESPATDAPTPETTEEDGGD